MASSSPSTYADCVASLRTSLSLVESSVATLGAGVADFPRLVAVLKTVRVRICPCPPMAWHACSMCTRAS